MRSVALTIPIVDVVPAEPYRPPPASVGLILPARKTSGFKPAVGVNGLDHPAREVAEAYAAPWVENAREFANGVPFIGKRAEGAFANDCVERFVREEQALGVTALKSDERRQLFGRREFTRTSDIFPAVIDAHNMTAEALGQEKSAGTLTASHIEDMAARR